MIAHLDLDAFYAAVELHRRPELRGKPLVVGGDPHGRGVVATASYEARKHGIRSAMSSAEALRRCPDVVFVRPDHREYRDWSRRVWGLVGELAPVVEQIGIDEGYLVLPDGDPPEEAARIQQAIRAQVRLSSSLGVASCKVVAKIASDMRKPGGIMYVPSGEEAAFLAPLDVRKLPGVGPKSERRLRDAGIQTIGALASLDDGRLRELMPGKVGEELRDRARGIDPRIVSGEPSEAVSMSVEETFERDLHDRGELHDRLRPMAIELAGRRCAARRWLRGRSPRSSATPTSRSSRGRRARPSASTTPSGSRRWRARCSTGAGRQARRAAADRRRRLRLRASRAADAARRLSYAATADEELTGRSSRCWCDGQ